MVRRKSLVDLDPWLEGAGTSLVAPFAKGIIKNKVAVSAAISSNWSNGQTEGQITKLKLVKRQMYGRGKLDLLQARLIARSMKAASSILRQSHFSTPDHSVRAATRVNAEQAPKSRCAGRPDCNFGEG